MEIFCIVVAVLQERCGIVWIGDPNGSGWIGLVMLFVPCATLHKFPSLEADFKSIDWYITIKI